MSNIKENLPQYLFLLFVVLVTFVFFGMIKEFSLGVFWAVVLSILFADWHKRVTKKFKGKRNLSAAITLLSIILLVIIPVAVLTTAIVNESFGLVEKIQSEDFDLMARVSEVQTKYSPQLKRLGIPIDNIQATLNKIAPEFPTLLGKKMLTFSQNILGSFVQIAIMLYVLFFFLRDGKKIIRLIIKYFPMLDSTEYRLINRFQSVTKATVKGSLLIAVIQGVAGGILFLSVGVEAAILWGTLMILASLLPIGGAIIWGPIGIIYIINGAYVKGIVVLAVGGLLIGLLDNFLRPRLVGNDTKLPDYLILLSTLGGITCFGLSGFVLGPVIAALFITCWQMVGENYGTVKKRNIT